MPSETVAIMVAPTTRRNNLTSLPSLEVPPAPDGLSANGER